MKTEFRKYLSQYFSLSQQEWEAMDEASNIQFVHRGGSINGSDQMNFVLTGIFRSYALLDNSEVTWNFYFPNRIATDFQSFLTGNPSQLTFVALEKSYILTMNKRSINKMQEQIPSLERIEKHFAELAFLDMRSRMESFFFLPEEERYLKLRANAPELVSNLPAKDLATYLGITAQSLSRIKRRILKTDK